MQKELKLLQTDLERDEELQEATNGAAQNSHPYYPQWEGAHSLPGLQRYVASGEDLSLFLLPVSGVGQGDTSRVRAPPLAKHTSNGSGEFNE